MRLRKKKYRKLKRKQRLRNRSYKNPPSQIPLPQNSQTQTAPVKNVLEKPMPKNARDMIVTQTLIRRLTKKIITKLPIRMTERENIILYRQMIK